MKWFLKVALLVVLILKSQGSIYAAPDWEYWSKYALEIALNRKVSFSLEPQFKFKNNFKEYYYSKTYLGLSYKLSKFITVKGYYAYKTKKGRTNWKGSDLIYLDPTLKLNLNYVKLGNRFRLEYDLDKEELVYRNRLKMEKDLNNIIAPFIQEEIFYSFLSHRFEENRFSVGSSVKVTPKVNLSGEYMLNSKKDDSMWRTANVLVTTLSFLF
ncbi:MAG: DUF2490 domain-containing protein [Candidatus Zixiibacteriota bacterium]